MFFYSKMKPQQQRMEAVGAEVIFGMTGSTDDFSDYWKKTLACRLVNGQ